MKLPAGRAWEGILASLLLHLAAAVVLIHGASFRPARTLPVIDLTLLPATAPGAVESARPAGVGDPRTARKAARAAAPPPPPAPDSIAGNGPEESAAAPPAPVATSAAATAPTASPAAVTGTASSAATGFAGGGGPGALSAPASAGSGVVSTVPGYDYLREAIQREAFYPPAARRMGWEGRVVVAFVIQPNGSVRDIRVVRGSGHEILDRNAVEAVRSASPFPRPPAEAEILTPVVYRLE